jgi:hypothetical protein
MGIMTVVTERSCENCGAPVAGRADKRYCSDVCRTAHRRSRTGQRTHSDSRTGSVSAEKALVAWDPPSPPQPDTQWRPTGEACLDCGGELVTRARGTIRLCIPCGRRVVPPRMQAPYERGPGQQRPARTQAEKDTAAIALARRKGVMLEQLEQLDADGRIRAEDRPVLAWFRHEVTAAGSEARLDQLTDAWKEHGPRPRRWWHADLPEIASGLQDDCDGEDQVYAADLAGDDEDQGDDDYPRSATAVTPLTAVTLQPHEWPRGWSMVAPGHDRRCQVVEATAGACTAAAEHRVPLADVCGRHHRLLAAWQAAR